MISNVYEETTERVYNFEVSGTHTYFAGDVGAWVHNSFGKLVRDGFVGALGAITLTPQVLKSHLKQLEKIERLASCDDLDDNLFQAGTPRFDPGKLPNRGRGKPK